MPNQLAPEEVHAVVKALSDLYVQEARATSIEPSPSSARPKTNKLRASRDSKSASMPTRSHLASALRTSITLPCRSQASFVSSSSVRWSDGRSDGSAASTPPSEALESLTRSVVPLLVRGDRGSSSNGAQ